MAVAGLLASYLAPYVDPKNFWFVAFFGLAYPVLVIANICFVVYWAVQLKLRCLISLAAILGGWMTLRNFAQVSFEGSPAEDSTKTRIKVMSYNVRLFDLYNWSNNLQTRDKMFSLIADQAPDIMCLQEFYTSENGKFNNLDTLLKLQKAKCYDAEYTITLRSTDHWGIATFSVYPIVNSGKIVFNTRSNNICIFSDLLIGSDTVRVYNMHLQSIKFGYADYKFIEDLKKNGEAEEFDEKSMNLLRRLKRGFVKRSEQASLVADHIARCPYPVIVCGDFNDTPSSFVYHRIGEGLTDAFVESGNGLGRTYVGEFPSFRIDYILHSPQLKGYNFNTVHERLSDHFPITCTLETGANK